MWKISTMQAVQQDYVGLEFPLFPFILQEFQSLLPLWTLVPVETLFAAAQGRAFPPRSQTLAIPSHYTSPHTHTVSDSVPSDRSSEWGCLRRYWREADHQNDPPPERKTLHHCVLMWGTLAEVACLVHAQKKNASSRNDPSSGDHEKRSSSARF